MDKYSSREGRQLPITYLQIWDSFHPWTGNSGQRQMSGKRKKENEDKQWRQEMFDKVKGHTFYGRSSEIPKG